MKINNRGIDLFFSSSCNMRCKYCYIFHNEKLIEANKKIRKNIIDGTYISQCRKIFNSDIVDNLGLWGAEPTMNSDVSDILMDQFLGEFRQINEVMFSTNFLNGVDRVLAIVKSANKHAIKLKNNKLEKFALQISIDGPEYMTDLNRHKGATKKILEGLQETIDECEKLTNIEKIYITFKPTINQDNIKDMVDNPHLIVEWYKFFEKIKDTIKTEHCKIVKFIPLARQTLVNIGNFSSEDGKIFKKYLELTYAINTEEAVLKYYKQPLFIAHFRDIETILYRFDRSLIKAHEITCGGGDYSMGVNCDGKICCCHRVYSLPYEDNKLNQDIYKSLAASMNNDNEIERIKYILGSYHDYNALRIANNKAMLLHCARCGLVDTKYIEDEDLLNYTAIFLSGIQCYLDSAISYTRSINVGSLSYILLFGNGAFEILLKNWIKYQML